MTVVAVEAWVEAPLRRFVEDARTVLALMVGKAIKYPAFTIPWGTLIIFLVAAIVAGVGTAIIPARRAGRLNILEALQYE